ncbi:MAG: hypothetical protein ACLUE8_13905 [Lachnospiraceae bacterium]
MLAKGTAGTATASKEDASTPRRTFWMTFAALLVCWLPYYLAYFPGMFNYDSAGEATQFTTGQYSGAFPPLHTLLLAAFYWLGEALGSYNAGSPCIRLFRPVRWRLRWLMPTQCCAVWV